MEYFKDLGNIFSKIEVKDKQQKRIPLKAAVSRISSLAITRNKKGNKAVFIGNGGSASIASHISTDFLKNAGISAVALDNTSLLTCLSNDLGYEYVFQKPIEMLGKKDDILFSISSSGASKNILNATLAAEKRMLYVITLSGFKRDNPLRVLGDINFYVPSSSYGYVEIAHLVICHAIADRIISDKSSDG